MSRVKPTDSVRDIKCQSLALTTRTNSNPSCLFPLLQDVLFGRGSAISSHPGNVRFRSIVESHKPEFRSADRMGKRPIAQKIVNAIHREPTNGRFLMEDPEAPESEASDAINLRSWVIVDNTKAINKTMHRLREKDPQDKRKGGMASSARGASLTGSTVESILPKYGKPMSHPCATTVESISPQSPAAKNEILRTKGSLVLRRIGQKAAAPIAPVEGSPDAREEDSLFRDMFEGGDSTYMNRTTSDASRDAPSKKNGAGSNSNTDGDALALLMHLKNSGTAGSADASDDEKLEINLRAWIQDNMPCDGCSSKMMRPYTAKALPIAVKLAELFEHSDGKSSLPQSCEEVTVHFISSNVANVSMPNGLSRSINVVSNEGERLAHMGRLLYELFLGIPPPLLSGRVGALVDGLSLKSHSNAIHKPRKVTSRMRNSSSSCLETGGVNSQATSHLEMSGLPYSLCSFLRNLLDCSSGDFRTDESYQSFKDARFDLNLMKDDPDVFLEDVQVTKGGLELKMRDKIYGRAELVSEIEQCLEDNIKRGVLVSGSAGVGKTTLLTSVMLNAAARSGSYFFQTKFEQSKNANPLANVASVFDCLCRSFLEDASERQLQAVADELTSALGVHIALILNIVPGLADANSMAIISELILDASEDCNTFFVCLYRSDDICKDSLFSGWINRLEETCPVQPIKIDNLTPFCVNEMVSEMLQTFPRITRPLSSILFAKSRGNPLFLRQLFDSLRQQGFIHIRFSPPKWEWDIDKIVDIEIPTSIMTLIIAELGTLPLPLQNSLRIISCLGSNIKCVPTFDIISRSIGIDMTDSMKELAHRGFVILEKGMMRFIHDKVQESAYQTLDDKGRRKNHMQFGLALLPSGAVDGRIVDDEMFFLALNQINTAGPGMLESVEERSVVAQLNLVAGNRSAALSDLGAALGFFKNGILFLPSDKWSRYYASTLELFTALVETAHLLKHADDVTDYSKEVVANAQKYEDKMRCECLRNSSLGIWLLSSQRYFFQGLHVVVMTVRDKGMFVESVKLAFEVLEKSNERIPREIGDGKLAAELTMMVTALDGMSDDFIMSLPDSPQGDLDIRVMNIYNALAFVLNEILAFVFFAGCVSSLGHNALGYRLSKLSFRLIDRTNGHQHYPAVAMIAGSTVDWKVEPLMSVAETHLLGSTKGNQVGDIVYTEQNLLMYNTNLFLCGKNLNFVRGQFLAVAGKLYKNKQKLALHQASAKARAAVDFIGGVDSRDYGRESPFEPPTWNALGDDPQMKGALDAPFVYFSLHYKRSMLLTRDFSDLPSNGLLARIASRKKTMRIIFAVGVFYEGLSSFFLARRHSHQHCEVGMRALDFISMYSQANPYTFENKHLLLKAMLQQLSNSPEAGATFLASISHARQNKFIVEEGLACEMASYYFFSRGDADKSNTLKRHAAICYNEWGGLAVAQRVDAEICDIFGGDRLGNNEIIERSRSNGNMNPKKRQQA
ncbi:hypothetical protein THAOC_10479 [Thalassiosira oceanica]|uniref:Uncharacterized protein n=1 Tax=Thalassiosira oceanica TaxID=159749 RepID=K0T4P5_THAOC|nr:hypothetical protein THAOC_10479 [Thalassiosira oceanica]|eukprot:EJK68346.1 hypothetical protein THAOC_10479 [Thalassiosira oceanica]